jgi:hypothetical protein
LVFAAGCGASDGTPSNDATEGADTTSAVPAFVGTDAPATVMFTRTAGEPSVEMHATSPELAKALKTLTDQTQGDFAFAASTFRFGANDHNPLKDFGAKGLACSLSPLQLAFDFMFFTIEPKRDGEDAHNSLDGDDMSCSPIQKNTKSNRNLSQEQVLVSAFRKGTNLLPGPNDPPISGADRTTRLKASDAAVQSFLKGNTGQIFECNWDNSDDETGYELVSIDVASGEVRVLMMYQHA